MCASTPGVDTLTESSRPAARAGGLVPGHAYTVIQARKLHRGPYAGAEVLQMRNPWGTFEWKGAWSDGSKELEACRAELEDDGIDSNDAVAGDDGEPNPSPKPPDPEPRRRPWPSPPGPDRGPSPGAYEQPWPWACP